MKCRICLVLVILLLFENLNAVSPGEIKLLCTLFPETFKDKCSEFIHKKPNQIEIYANIKIQMINIKDTESIQCQMCKKLIQNVIDAIGNNRSRDVIKNELEKVCEKVPEIWKSECRRYTDYYSDLFVREIITNSSGKQICPQINLCSSRLVKSSPEVQSIDCTLCKLVIKEIFRRIGNSRAENKIRKALNKICNILPFSLRKDCKKFMNRFSNEIVNLIMNNASPKIICRTLQLCSVSEEKSVQAIKAEDTLYFFPKFSLD